MSCYILNVLTHGQLSDKAGYLVSKHKAMHIHEPATFEGCPPGHVYVCVLDNATFEAAFVCLTAYDFRNVKYDGTGRGRTWLLMSVDQVRPLVEMRYLDEPVLQ